MRTKIGLATLSLLTAVCATVMPYTEVNAAPPRASGAIRTGSPTRPDADAEQKGGDGPRDFSVDDDLQFIVLAPPFDCLPWRVGGRVRATLTPPERLFVYRPWSPIDLTDAPLCCTINWIGGDVLLKRNGGDILFRKTENDPWRRHSVVLRDRAALRELESRGLAHAPYSIMVRYPIDRVVASVARSLGVREIVIRPGSTEPEKPDDLLDLAPLAHFPLESLILQPSGEGKLAIRGLQDIPCLESLVIECYKNEAFPLRMVKDCTNIRYLNIFASNLDVDADPRIFSKLTYCRITAGKAAGMSRFVQGVAAKYLHLGVNVGLAELGPKVPLNPAVKHLLIENNLDLKDISPLKASSTLAELKIRGCRWLKPSDGFVRSDPGVLGQRR